MSNLQAIAVYINKNESMEEIKNKIIESLGFDADWSGDNGDEYLLQEAVGFESNNQWFIETHFKSTKEEDVEIFFTEYFNLNNYWDYSVNIVENNDNLFIAIALSSDN